MINIKKNLLMLFYMLTVVLFVPNKAFANTYKDMGNEVNVSIDKVWNINFNEDVDITTTNKDNIVVTDEKGKFVSIDIRNESSRRVSVSPIKMYKPNSKYTLLVRENVKSINGKKIKEPVRMRFLTKKNYITTVSDITEVTSQGSRYDFPEKLEATMSDGTTIKIPVKWNIELADTSKSGTYSFEGKIEGYPRIITLTLIINKRIIPQKDFKVVIDPAGGANIKSSSVGPTGINEKDVNLAIALKLGNLLKGKGISVVYTRNGDKVSWNENKDDSERIKLSNNSNSDLFVSINSNSYNIPSSHGIETYYYKNDNISKELASEVQESIISSTGGTDRGIKERDFGILKGIEKPGIIVYPGFITNPSEEKLLNDAIYRDKIAKAIADNIEKNMSNLNTKIKLVNDVNINAYQGEQCNLPSKISAINTDNKDIQVPVTWDKSSVDTSKVGTIRVKGKIEGYDKSVIVTIVISDKPSKKIKVAIDPGHGGYDSGAVGPNGICEKNVTMGVALKLRKVLEQKGIEVIYTRTSDKCPWPSDKNAELQMRCDIANNAKADYFVSIHCNSADASSATGIETYYDRNRTNGIELAKNIQSELIREFGYKNRGVKPCGFYVVKNTNMPAVLVELEFISNENREQSLNNSTYQQRYAESIAKGITDTIEK